MFWDWPHTLGFIALAFLIYILGPRIWRGMQHFDAENRERIERNRADRRDKNAHFRHTFEVAEEQVEAVQEVQGEDPRTGTPVTYYLFEGDSFFTREAADAARAERIYKIARGFYEELPGALLRHSRRGNLGRD